MNLTENPWTVMAADIVYENPWIKVTEHKVLNPAGKPGIYGTVSFHNRAVAVVPIDDKGFTWLVGQYRFPLQEYHWEVPMGGAPAGEQAEACALRELQEETGLQASQLTCLGRVHTSNSITDEVGLIFLAQGLSETVATPEETEVLQVKRLPFDEVFRMVMDGRITDAISVLAIQRIRLLGLA